MRSNALASVLIILFIALIAIGFMRGWFALNTAQSPSGKTDIELSIDPQKARQDAEKVQHRTDEFLDKVKTDATDLRDTTVQPQQP